MSAIGQIVVTTTNDSGAGSLRQAISDSTPGGTITFTNTLSAQTILLTAGQLVITQDLTVDASALSDRVVIDGNGLVGSNRVMEVVAGAVVTLDSLVITGGRTPDSANHVGTQGGGIFNAGKLTLRYCTIADNKTGIAPGSGSPMFANSGGGICNSNGIVSIQSSTISGNTTGGSGGTGGYGGYGGGLCNNGGTVTIDSSTITSNATGGSGGNYGFGGYGGGIFNIFGTITLSNSTVSDNTTGSGGSFYSASGGWGGGIHSQNGIVIIRDSVVCSNRPGAAGRSGSGYGGSGGGISYEYSTITIENSTVASNIAGSGQAGGGGGGMRGSGGAKCTLNNVTVSGNAAGMGQSVFQNGHGGGIYTSSGGVAGTVHSTNSIIAGNTAATHTNVRAFILGGGNLTNGVPLLAPLGNYGGPTQTMPPIPGSPAIDTADATTLTNDQRGLPRVGSPDIGAAEFQGSSDISLFWPTDWDGDGQPFGVENALGSDPLVADPDAPGNPQSHPPITGNGIKFGFNSNATNYTAWVVKRSLDLAADPFAEVYRYDGPTGTTTVTNGLTVNLTLDSIEITDNTDPLPPTSLYQLCIEPSP